MGVLMPEFHDRLDNPFCLSVGSWGLDLRETLLDSVFPAKGHEGMMFWIAPVLLPIIAVELLYRIGTFLQDLFQKCLGRSLGLVRKDRCVQFSGEVINRHKEILSSPEGGFSLKQRKSLRVHVKHLPGIILVVTLGLGL